MNNTQSDPFVALVDKTILTGDSTELDVYMKENNMVNGWVISCAAKMKHSTNQAETKFRLDGKNCIITGFRHITATEKKVINLVYAEYLKNPNIGVYGTQHIHVEFKDNGIMMFKNTKTRAKNGFSEHSYKFI